jgi:general stress protein YciG
MGFGTIKKVQTPLVNESHRRSTIKEVGHSQPTTVKTNATKEVIVAGTKEGGKKAAATNKSKYGNKFYANIGRKGGSNGHTGGFASDEVGADGLTGQQRAKIAGAKGGKISKRGPAKYPHLSNHDLTVRMAKERRRLRAEIRVTEAAEDWND